MVPAGGRWWLVRVGEYVEPPSHLHHFGPTEILPVAGWSPRSDGGWLPVLAGSDGIRAQELREHDYLVREDQPELEEAQALVRALKLRATLVDARERDEPDNEHQIRDCSRKALEYLRGVECAGIVELARTLGVSRDVALTALTLLEERGLVKADRRSGHSSFEITRRE